MKRRAKKSTTRAFTLIELMLVIGMMAILAGAVAMALAQAAEQGRVSRTQAQIARIHGLLMTRFDTYRTRTYRIPNSYYVAQGITGAPNATQRAAARLGMLRETMRLEMPDCAGDIVDIVSGNPVLTVPAERFSALAFTSHPSLSANYFRRVQDYPGFVANNRAVESECLYLILSSIQDGDTNGLDFLLPSEIGDTDGDGMKEILDSWGRPIVFMRWAPGYTNYPGAIYSVTNLVQNGKDPDPFDTLKVDASRGTFALIPLVVSAGPDGAVGLITPNFDTESSDPYYLLPPNPSAFGSPGVTSSPDVNAGVEFWHDNITNHALSQQ